MRKSLEHLAAYWHSLRYQRPQQVAWRLRYWLQWKLYRLFPVAARLTTGTSARGSRPRAGFVWPEDSAAKQPAHGDAACSPGEPAGGYLGANRFRFLNREHDFGERIDWAAPQFPLLWRFHLHYFGWAQTCEPETLVRQMESWIAANPPGSWPGWHPYPASLRIRSWIRAAARWSQAAARPKILASLADQAAFLENNLEFHLGGNHLMENAGALLAAGLFFEGAAARRWRARGLALLRQEVERQVLADGGHFERSTYYHDRMTRLVAESAALLEPHGPAPADLKETAAKMQIFRAALRHQDGRAPLFHDSLECGVPAPPCDGERTGPLSFSASGFYILDGPDGRLIADYGAPGGCYNPAHQHAGIFSFEISSGFHRVIVDTGTFTYEPGRERDYLRSTAAHNTVRVDGTDQFQVWKSFRVGRRAWVTGVSEQRAADFQAIAAKHDGYRRWGLAHRRAIICLPGAGWLVVDDLEESGAGRTSAGGVHVYRSNMHHIESFLHLEPAIRAGRLRGRVRSGRDDEAARVVLEPAGWSVLAFGLSEAFEIRADRHAPAPGVVFDSQQLVLQGRAPVPCRFGYLIGAGSETLLRWDRGDCFEIATPERVIRVVVQRGDPGVASVSYNGPPPVLSGH